MSATGNGHQATNFRKQIQLTWTSSLETNIVLGWAFTVAILFHLLVTFILHIHLQFDALIENWSTISCRTLSKHGSGKSIKKRVVQSVYVYITMLNVYI